MNRMTFRNMARLILILLIPICLCIFYIYKLKPEEKARIPDIFEIRDTQSVYYSLDNKDATIEKNYMIINPPENLVRLKSLIEQYINRNPINYEDVKREVEKERNGGGAVINQVLVCVYFYRESSRLPKNWRPNEAYLNTDRMEHHKDDCIASIFWSDSEPQKNFSMMKKSSYSSDYGELIESFEYVDDKLIQHQIFKK